MVDLHHMPLRGGSEHFLVLQDHLDWATGLKGHQARGALDGDIDLAAESSADNGLDHADFLLRQPGDPTDLFVMKMRILGADQKCQYVVVEERHPCLCFQITMLDWSVFVGALDDEIR